MGSSPTTNYDLNCSNSVDVVVAKGRRGGKRVTSGRVDMANWAYEKASVSPTKKVATGNRATSS